jgi:hypothetical protein
MDRLGRQVETTKSKRRINVLGLGNNGDPQELNTGSRSTEDRTE